MSYLNAKMREPNTPSTRDRGICTRENGKLNIYNLYEFVPPQISILLSLNSQESKLKPVSNIRYCIFLTLSRNSYLHTVDRIWMFIKLCLRYLFI